MRIGKNYRYHNRADSTQRDTHRRLHCIKQFRFHKFVIAGGVLLRYRQQQDRMNPELYVAKSKVAKSKNASRV